MVVTQGCCRWADEFRFGGKVDNLGLDLGVLTMTMMTDLGKAGK